MAIKEIKKYFIALIIVLVLDLIWIFLIADSFYDYSFLEFERPLSAPIWSAVFAWMLIPLGIILFVDKISKNKKEYLINGALYGLILYGVYDFTNYATLQGWKIEMVFVDILWGMFLCSFSSLLYYIFKNKISTKFK